MAEYYRTKLAGSGAGGRGIKVAATSTPGTSIHTAPVETSVYDMLWLWAHNSDTSSRKLTIEFGGTSAPDDLIEVTLQPEFGLIPVVAGMIVRDGCIVRAFAASANVISIFGYVNRYLA